MLVYFYEISGWISSIIKCLTVKYLKFEGRAQRTEFWSFFIFYIIGTFIAAFIDGFFDLNLSDDPDGLGPVSSCFVILTILPLFAVTIRRLHDISRSGWWLLMAAIPFANLYLLVIYCFKGTIGSNHFGIDVSNPDVKGRSELLPEFLQRLNQLEKAQET